MMANKKRVPMQVSPNFRDEMQKLRRKIIANGGMEKSLRDLTDELAKSSTLFDEIERKILNSKEININIRFDGRKRR